MSRGGWWEKARRFAESLGRRLESLQRHPQSDVIPSGELDHPWPPIAAVIDGLLDPELSDRIEAAAEEAGGGLRELQKRQATREEDQRLRQALNRAGTPPDHLTADKLHQLMEATEISAVEACRVAWHLLGDCTRCREALRQAGEMEIQATETSDPLLLALRETRPGRMPGRSEAEQSAIRDLFDGHPTAFARLVLEGTTHRGLTSPAALATLDVAMLPIAEASRHRLAADDLVHLRGRWRLARAELLAGHDPDRAVEEAMEAASHFAVSSRDSEETGIGIGRPELSALSDPLRDLFRPVAQRWLLTLRKLGAVLEELTLENPTEAHGKPRKAPSRPADSPEELPPGWVTHQESSTSVLREFDFASFEEAAGYLQSLKDLLSSPEAPEFEVSIQGGSLILRITVTDPEQASQFIHLLASHGESSAQG